MTPIIITFFRSATGNVQQGRNHFSSKIISQQNRALLFCDFLAICPVLPAAFTEMVLALKR